MDDGVIVDEEDIHDGKCYPQLHSEPQFPTIFAKINLAAIALLIPMSWHRPGFLPKLNAFLKHFRYRQG